MVGLQRGGATGTCDVWVPWHSDRDLWCLGATGTCGVWVPWRSNRDL